MPRITKDTKKEELNVEKKTKTTKKKASTTTKKEATTKTKKSTTTANKPSKSNTSTTKKDSTDSKNSSTTTKSKTSKTTTSSSTQKKQTTIRKTSTKKTTGKSRKLENSIVAEYYDLPYRYNETIVKILYQTPNVLFVYWDISDEDRNNYIKQFGEHFFYNTKPILKIFNLTKNYNFEVEINDFANSWYIHVNDANCEYKVELARRVVNYEENIYNEYIPISTSNDMKFPNDHILLDELPDKINFRNVKTNEITTKDITTLRLVGINKIYRVRDFYKTFYKDELLEELDNSKIKILSSSSSIGN